MKAKNSNQGYYLLEADLERNVYLKEETILSDFGHFHNGVEFIFMIEGRIHARAHTELMTVSAGEIFIANSFEYHCYEKLTPDIRAIVLVLSREYLSDFREFYKGKIFPTHLDCREKNSDIITLMQNWVAETEKSYLLNLGYSNLLFSKIVERYGLTDFRETREKTAALKLLKYINEHFDKDITLRQIAHELGYTKEYCSKILKEVTGVGFRQYLNSLRLRKARALFDGRKESKLTTLEIIYQCGFNSAATFYRAFKATSFREKQEKEDEI